MLFTFKLISLNDMESKGMRANESLMKLDECTQKRETLMINYFKCYQS